MTVDTRDTVRITPESVMNEIISSCKYIKRLLRQQYKLEADIVSKNDALEYNRESMSDRDIKKYTDKLRIANKDLDTVKFEISNTIESILYDSQERFQDVYKRKIEVLKRKRPW